jgi:hypothetical protein
VCFDRSRVSDFSSLRQSRLSTCPHQIACDPPEGFCHRSSRYTLEACKHPGVAHVFPSRLLLAFCTFFALLALSNAFEMPGKHHQRKDSVKRGLSCFPDTVNCKGPLTYYFDSDNCYPGNIIDIVQVFQPPIDAAPGRCLTPQPKNCSWNNGAAQPDRPVPCSLTTRIRSRMTALASTTQ